MAAAAVALLAVLAAARDHDACETAQQAFSECVPYVVGQAPAASPHCCTGLGDLRDMGGGGVAARALRLRPVGGAGRRRDGTPPRRRARRRVQGPRRLRPDQARLQLLSVRASRCARCNFHFVWTQTIGVSYPLLHLMQGSVRRSRKVSVRFHEEHQRRWHERENDNAVSIWLFQNEGHFVFCHVISVLLHVKRAFELQRVLPFLFRKCPTVREHLPISSFFLLEERKRPAVQQLHIGNHEGCVLVWLQS
jgi:hypothetical protein